MCKLTTYSTVQLNQSYCKQIDSCSIGGCLSVILDDIPIAITINEVVKVMNPPLCK